MKKAFWLVFVLSFFLITVSLTNLACADGPKLLIPGTRFDFGYAPTSSVISHYYLVKNVGSDSLKIERVKPG